MRKGKIRLAMCSDHYPSNMEVHWKPFHWENKFAGIRGKWGCFGIPCKEHHVKKIPQRYAHIPASPASLLVCLSEGLTGSHTPEQNPSERAFFEGSLEPCLPGGSQNPKRTKVWRWSAGSHVVGRPHTFLLGSLLQFVCAWLTQFPWPYPLPALPAFVWLLTFLKGILFGLDRKPKGDTTHLL